MGSRVGKDAGLDGRSIAAGVLPQMAGASDIRALQEVDYRNGNSQQLAGPRLYSQRNRTMGGEGEPTYAHRRYRAHQSRRSSCQSMLVSSSNRAVQMLQNSQNARCLSGSIEDIPKSEEVIFCRRCPPSAGFPQRTVQDGDEECCRCELVSTRLL